MTTMRPDHLLNVASVTPLPFLASAAQAIARAPLCTTSDRTCLERPVGSGEPFPVRRAQRFRVRKGLITQVAIINHAGKSTASIWSSDAM